MGWVGDGRDRRRADRRRPGIPVPFPLAVAQLGERFGVPPWEIEQAPADRVLYYLAVLGREARYRDLLADVQWDDVLVGFWDDEGG